MNFDWILREADTIASLFGWHAFLSVVPVALGLVISLPLGWAAHRSGVFKSIALGTTGLLYTVPSLALFVLLPPLLGTKILDSINVVIALTVYTVALLVRTVSDGLDSVSIETTQAAEAMGYRRFQRLIAVELPVAVPVIAAGLRVAVVSNVSVVSIAALIGTEQLGLLFTQGAQQRFITPIIVGLVLCLVLAMALDGIVILMTRLLTPWMPKAVKP